MEEKALDILRLMLSRRGEETKTERVVNQDERIANTNIYQVGNYTVFFSQRENGITWRDLEKYVAIAGRKNMIIVGLVPPSESVLKYIKPASKNRMYVFHIRQLQFDIMSHRMAMPHRILKKEERTALFKKYNVTNPEDQLPWIDSQDTMIKWIGAIPGDVVEVTRHSDVAGPQLYYRYVVPDVNVA